MFCLTSLLMRAVHFLHENRLPNFVAFIVIFLTTIFSRIRLLKYTEQQYPAVSIEMFPKGIW